MKIKILNRKLMLLLIIAIFCSSNSAQSPPSEETNDTKSPPDFNILPSEEDWSVMRDPALRRNLLDRVKYIPLVPGEKDWYLSIGGETKPRYEYFNDENWGATTPADPNGYFLQRYMLHFNFNLGKRRRVFIDVKSGVENNRRSGARPIDENYFALHQAFAEFGFGKTVKFQSTAPGGENPPEIEVSVVSVRAGRQEFLFGAGRLVTMREGTNVRLSFDAVKATYRKDKWRADAFVAKPVEIDKSSFDDPIASQTFWGIYAARPVKLLPGKGNIDVYYFGLDKKRVRFNQGNAREIRQTFGTRIWGTRRNWEYDHEFILQAGKFGGGDILAGAVSYNIAYNFSKSNFKPRLSLNGDVISGDRDRKDANLNTLNPLFPNNGYHGDLNLLTPANLLDVVPSVRFSLTKRLSVSFENYFFWRQSLNDGVYSPGVVLTKHADLSRARYVGFQPLVNMQYKVDRHTSLTAIYAHFFAGKFIRETPPGEDVNYFTAYLKYQF